MARAEDSRLEELSRAAWEERAADARLVLNPAQEQALWAGIAGRGALAGHAAGGAAAAAGGAGDGGA